VVNAVSDHPDTVAPLVLVTRPQPQADEWVQQLRALGVLAQAFPLLGIAGPPDEQAVAQAWQQLPGMALVMFVSPSAVVRFFALQPPDQPWPPQVLAGSTGPGTAKALAAAGVPTQAVVSPPVQAGQFDSEALWACLQGQRDWAGQAVLIVRGEGGRDWLADTLRQHGAQVHFVEAYRRTKPVLDATRQVLLQAALAHPQDHVWLFSSSEAVGQLPALAPGADWSAANALVTHPRIGQAARLLGMARVQQIRPDPTAVAQVVQGVDGL
jgi:uroporphyrinogen-III synthase